MGDMQTGSKQYWWKKSEEAAETAVPQMTVSAKEDTQPGDLCLLTTPKAGDTCPFCHEGELHYDGLFLLVCNRCNKIAEGGCFT
ncbi:MAG: hypothetical protein H6662_09610 [Ardenticatenaceae bacterium]|nr:hypothetical protein [Anaerolineales bacterium]MCB8921829.1 hypothetical protein [Ardenticatenaceae bacterium]MCB8991013.1 hypothetical protein [Ardenticatenaceae bacterium]MCB9005307.1 hypothetical protein [Ardenticatenaceae bacterium]